MLNTYSVVFIVLLIFEAAGFAMEEHVFQQRLSGSESLVITVIPTNVTWKTEMVSEVFRLPGRSANSPPRVPVTKVVRTAYLMYYTNSANGAQIPLWIQMIYEIKEDRGTKGLLTEGEKRPFPLVFSSAFFDPTSRICGLHLQNVNGKSAVWYADPLTTGTNSFVLSSGITFQIPKEKRIKTSRFNFDSVERRLVLHIDYQGGDQDEILIDPIGFRLIPLEKKK